MAATITTTTQVAGPVNYVFQRELLRRANQTCPYFAGSTPAEIMQHGNSFSAKWRRFTQLTPTTTALSELTGTLSLPTRNASQLAVTDITATVAKYGDVVIITEEVDLVNENNLGMEIAGLLGEQAGRSLNMLQRNELEDNLTTVLRTGGAASNGAIVSGITANALKKAGQTLKVNAGRTFTARTNGSTNIGTVPVLPAYWGFCHPYVATDIAALLGFISVEKYAGQIETVPGEFGYYPNAGAGIRFVQSEDATVDANAGGSVGSTGLRSTGASKIDLFTVPIIAQDCHGSLGFGTKHIKEIYMAGDKLPAVQMIVKNRGSSGIADPLDEFGTAAWKTWHAPKILNANWGVAVVCGASALSA